MKRKRCHQCGGRFGMVRRYYFFRKFCSERCLNGFKNDLQRELDRRRFHGWLYPRSL